MHAWNKNHLTPHPAFLTRKHPNLHPPKKFSLNTSYHILMQVHNNECPSIQDVPFAQTNFYEEDKARMALTY